MLPTSQLLRIPSFYKSHINTTVFQTFDSKLENGLFFWNKLLHYYKVLIKIKLNVHPLPHPKKIQKIEYSMRYWVT